MFYNFRYKYTIFWRNALQICKPLFISSFLQMNCLGIHYTKDMGIYIYPLKRHASKVMIKLRKKTEKNVINTNVSRQIIQKITQDITERSVSILFIFVNIYFGRFSFYSKFQKISFTHLEACSFLKTINSSYSKIKVYLYNYVHVM